MTPEEFARAEADGRVIKMTDTLARVNAALRKIRDEGGSTIIEDVSYEVFRDDDRGLFLRMTLLFTDGGTFSIDTVECQAHLERAERASATVN